MGIMGLFLGKYIGMEKGSWHSPSGCAAWQQMAEVSLHHYITSSADFICRLHPLGALARGIPPDSIYFVMQFTQINLFAVIFY